MNFNSGSRFHRLSESQRKASWTNQRAISWSYPADNNTKLKPAVAVLFKLVTWQHRLGLIPNLPALIDVSAQRETEKRAR
jgi:hypothetical protein